MTTTAKSLNVVMCWHMHQPYYREGLKGAYHLPWVYLHGIKDYSDMAAHLERYPAMRTVVNFAPVLLEQLDDYAQQLDVLLKHGKPTQDHMLNLLSGVERIPSDATSRLRIVRDCQRCNATRMIHPYPAFHRLLNMIGVADETGGDSAGLPWLMGYLSEQYFLDLLTWYHLVWLGHSLRQLPLVRRLMAQEKNYSAADRHELLHLMQHCIAGLIPRYRALAQRGQIELSMPPYGHPIVPLLNDFSHLRDALAELDKMGIVTWTASGEGVWRSSCSKSGCPQDQTQTKRALFSPAHVDGFKTRVFFRDDGLSDLIGFKYSDWHADDAVADFVQHLENIAAFFDKDANKHVVSVILDGENAWEYYPDNGHHFLNALYATLSSHPTLKVSTFAAQVTHTPSRPMQRLAAGSWVYGSFSTWIGSDDKNRGWDYLVAAKHAYDAVVAAGKLTADQLALATRQLAVCEGSDLFWWFGDYNPASSVSDFEQLYRTQLRELYRLLGVAPPALLDVPLSSGGGWAENAGTMRRNAG